MEVYLKKEKKMEVSIIKEGRKKTEIYIKKMEVYINKKRWMKDKRWIKDGNRPSTNLFGRGYCCPRTWQKSFGGKILDALHSICYSLLSITNKCVDSDLFPSSSKDCCSSYMGGNTYDKWSGATEFLYIDSSE